ncbi:ATP-dependent helicase [Kitasatospora sp. NBC_01560]|uniref:ATP-dependent helicase n=1 Tax=Kitasatospora sp. NBC_01560 TaxID=2975965 RepID=UPI00386D1368
MAPQTHPQPPADRPDDPLAGFAPATRAWFTGAFHAPTTAQARAWQAIGRGTDVLVVAPTGSGKTLAAFLSALDRLSSTPVPAEPKRRCRVLYISPLKALAVDVERNLRAPLAGLRQAAVRLGLPEPDVQVGIRSGDTPAADRRRFAGHPPDILITTPESLFLLLTSASREALRGIDTVILDEVHAVAGTKRGAHLALSLERLDELLERPARRIGLSATVRPVEEVARFLSPQRGAVVVQPPAEKEFDLSVVVPVPDLDDLPAAPPGPAAGGDDTTRKASIWPHVEERIVDLVQAHRSTIVFANSRRLAERLCNRLNEIALERAAGEPLPEAHSPAQLMAASGAAKGAPPVIARAHHGSVSKEQRALVEEELKAGRLPAVVATSSLELGIDMGAVELVVQVESPPSVASGLQRVGRAGHQVGAVSTGVFFPKYRGDLVQSAVVTERMRAGRIEALRIPRNPLDVLAQQLVAITALDTWPVDDLLALVRRAAPFATLPQSAFDAVLDMLAGRYPSDAFAELRPRLVWDRVAGTVTGRPGAQRLAVTSGGTIPDRGLFGVFIAGSTDGPADGKKGGGRRVGELDEEMVYESRVGDVFTLGTTSWRIEEITHDKVLVTPAPGIPGRLPFWKGDTLGRPLELGRALGAFTRELGALEPAAATARLRQAGLDDWAAGNLLDYLAEQRAACGHLPDDRTIVVERFRDELGDWRIVIHSPFGAQVHAPWALALGARLREKHGLDPQVMHADDGIVLRLPDADLLAPDFDFAAPAARPAPDDRAAADDAPVGADAAVFESGEIEQLVTDQVGGSALFASRFRECAGRALLLPRRNPGRRTPLWQQRQRAAQLLEVASEYGSFPIVLEAVRECLQDVFDVPGLVELMKDLESRAVRLVEVTTQEPSPFARSLLFGYVAQFLYEGDSPLAERRAAALSLDSRLLSELLGQAELRELLDPQVLAELEAELQRLTPERRIKDAEGVADALRLLGPLTEAELAARGAEPLWALELEAARRVIAVRIAGEQRWAAVEDAGRLRDALGTPLPVGVPEAFTEPVKDPLGDLLARHARTHGPFTSGGAAARFGLGTAVVTGTLQRLTAAGRLVQGEFSPPGAGLPSAPAAGAALPDGHGATVEWCDAEVLRRLRRRSLAALRHEVEAVPPRALAAFLPQWQHLAGHRLRGPDGLLRVVEQLQGTALPASALERLILPARLADYSPNLLDELMAAGEIGWSGAGALPGKDGWISLHLAENAHLLRPEPVPPAVTPVHTALLEALAGGYGLFFRQLVAHLPETPEAELVEALWDLVWAGYVSNDTLAPLRALLGSGRTAGATAHRAPRATPRGRYGGAGRPFGRIGGALRSGPPTVAGRWSLLPAPDADPTVRATARAQSLLDRHGLVTRGTVVAERVPGGFAGVYRVLAAMEERGRARRGYFVEGLGGAQFAMEGAADRLRSVSGRLDRARAATEWGAGPGAEPPQVLVLAAADPANAYGAALPWPEPPGGPGPAGPLPGDARPAGEAASAGAATGREGRAAKAHRPGRKAGALVVLVDGDPVLYVERGGKSLLAWREEGAALAPAAAALASAVRAGALGSVTVERANGEPALGSAIGAALEEAGFHATPRGLRLRP